MKELSESVEWKKKCEALGKIKKRGALSGSFDKETIRAVKVKLNDEEWRVRKAAVEVFAVTREQALADIVAPKLHDEHQWVRQASVELIGRCGAKKHTQTLEKMREDEDVKVRNAVEVCLSVWSKETGVGSIIEDVMRTEVEEKPVPKEGGKETRQCNICGVWKVKSAFSMKHWKRSPGSQHCQMCVRTRDKRPEPEESKISQESEFKAKGRKSESSATEIRPNNWGYLTYVDRVFSLDCFKEMLNKGP